MGEIFYDEVSEDSGEPRPHYRAAMEALGPVDLAALGEKLRARTLEHGVRYGSTGRDRFVIDAVPRMFSADEWDQLDRGLAQRVRALQELVELSRHPTLFGGELAKRRIDLRPLIASSNGEDATVLGGLTRVALGEDSKLVNMAQGGGVKATWATKR